MIPLQGSNDRVFEVSQLEGAVWEAVNSIMKNPLFDVRTLASKLS